MTQENRLYSDNATETIEITYLYNIDNELVITKVLSREPLVVMNKRSRKPGELPKKISLMRSVNDGLAY